MITILLSKIIALLTSIANKPPIWGGVEDLTENITFEDIINTDDTIIHCYRQGNIVWVNIRLLRVANSITHNTRMKLFSGLPVPYDELTYISLNDPASSSVAKFRCRLNENGEFYYWDSDIGLTTSTYCQMSFTYICKDSNSEVTP